MVALHGEREQVRTVSLAPTKCRSQLRRPTKFRCGLKKIRAQERPARAWAEADDEDHNAWGRRPLPERNLDYAAEDVLSVALGVRFFLALTPAQRRKAALRSGRDAALAQLPDESQRARAPETKEFTRE